MAPLAAPVVKPMTSGEPSGLREIDWKIAPAMPSGGVLALADCTSLDRKSVV